MAASDGSTWNVLQFGASQSGTPDPCAEPCMWVDDEKPFASEPYTKSCGDEVRGQAPGAKHGGTRVTCTKDSYHTRWLAKQGCTADCPERTAIRIKEECPPCP